MNQHQKATHKTKLTSFHSYRLHNFVFCRYLVDEIISSFLVTDYTRKYLDDIGRVKENTTHPSVLKSETQTGNAPPIPWQARRDSIFKHMVNIKQQYRSKVR